MRIFQIICLAPVLLAATAVVPVQASTLRVAPASVEILSPSRVAALSLRNEGSKPAHYQIRIFRWTQVNGAERMEPTRDVVVSPPITRIEPGNDYIVRIVRLDKRPISNEESFRVLVDELPETGNRTNGRIKFLIRYSIPVFFTGPNSIPSRVAWQIEQKNHRLIISASNRGNRRVRITNLKIRDTGGRTSILAKGLAGYVLAGKKRVWSFDSKKVKGLISGPAHLLCQQEMETVDVPVTLSHGN